MIGPGARYGHRFVLREAPFGSLRLEDVEKDLIRQALARTKGNVTQASTLLGITRERVRQIKEKALLRLRHASRARFLETFIH